MSQSATLERTPTAPDESGPAAGAPARSIQGRASARNTARHSSRQHTTWVAAGIGTVTVLLSVVLMAYAAPTRTSAPTGRAPVPRGPVQLQRDLRSARDAGLVPAFAPAGRTGAAGHGRPPAK